MKNNLYVMLCIDVIAGAIAGCSNSAVPAPAPAQAAQPTPQEAAAATVQVTRAARDTSAVPAPGIHTYVIDSTKSMAHFIVDEVLGGSPNTVDGKTNLVEGQIVADYSNPLAAVVSPIKVDLTGLVTDSGFRNTAIQQAILQTGSPGNRFVVFTPTKLAGLPDKVTIGQPFSFKITGTLALHGVTKEVTFDATVTPVSDTQLTGTASATISFAEWGIQILRLPSQVASVNHETILRLEFVANVQ